ncbi:hypothetical protein CHLRE_02g111150v5 [Chlamydomonas reinhardtii]|uniref:EGF-like domain-containing protein n=1 Tax=Chlamydomonas reinhardtii TaxID=3055 RepID=A0A2K3E315_CHLRE|nr:uncharacterized protein CHLRE_02g111150v5 [Chlamydomonas reinhardtii]PNW87153.1 hypothetical protein CHLRE_02g111150v5 [Chlamydomonas reinhardtii]
MRALLLCFLSLAFLSLITGQQGEPLLRFFKEAKKSCAAGCEENGNCNAETGECQCRFGYGGADCSQPILSGCLSARKKGAVPQYGLQFPKNCECYRQLLNISCYGSDFAKDPFWCNQPAIWEWHTIKCYEYMDVPPEQQLSDPPEAGSTKVVWRQGVRNDSAHRDGGFLFQPYTKTDGLRTQNLETLLPMDKCKDRCNERGRCVDAGGGLPQCVCAPFFTGPSCQLDDPSHCPLNCSGRGRCDGGFCHCQAGWWGAACTRSKAYTAEEWTPHPSELKIYVYDLPQHVAYMRPLGDHWPLHHSIYLAEIELYHRLLGDTTVVTENPWEANLFYVPTHTYYYIGNIGFPGKLYTAVFHHVRQQYPWWNLTAGRNHVVSNSNDRGCCDLYRMGPDVQHPIKVVHFAQAPRHGVPLSRNRDKGREAEGEKPEHLAARLNSHVEDPAMQGAIAEMQHLDGRPRFRGFPLYELPALQQEREQCYRPEHDVAFPPYLSDREGNWFSVMKEAYDYTPDGKATFKRGVARDTLFYFNGFTKPDLAYSAGVRQGLLALFGNSTRADLSINKGGGSQRMLRSRFCFTPMGFGWGIRLSQAMLTGCVPIMVHDHVWPTLWDVLPYEQFSIRVSRHNMYRLLDYLESITPQQLARLQDGVAQWHKAFVWQPEVGGLAYNYTLTSLHHRLLNMWTAFFRRF